MMDFVVRILLANYVGEIIAVSVFLGIIVWCQIGARNDTGQ